VDLGVTMASALQALGGSVKKLRRAAFDALAELARAGFSPSEATPLSAGLLALLPRLENPEVASVLRLLLDLACAGGRSAWTSARLEQAPFKPQPNVLAEFVAQSDLLLRFLDHADAKVRAAAGCLAALLPDGLAKLASAFAAEPKAEVAATWLLAMAHAGEGGRQAREALSVKKPLLQAAAALSLVLLEGLDAPSDELVRALALGISLPAPGEGLMPWFGGEPSPLVLSLVEKGGDGLRRRAVEALLDAARRASDKDALLSTAASLVFEAQPGIVVYHEPSELDPLQRFFVEALGDGRLAVSTCRPPLSRFGIPNDIWSRRIWLGIDPPGAIDRELEVEWQGKRQRMVLWQWFKAVYDQLWRKNIINSTDNEDDEDDDEDFDSDVAYAKWKAMVPPLIATWDPLFRLEVALEQPRIDELTTFPYYEGFAPKRVWKAAAKVDVQRAKAIVDAAAERQLLLSRFDSHRVHYTMLEIFLERVGPKETLDPRLEPIFLTANETQFKGACAKMGPAQREAFLLRRIEGRERVFLSNDESNFTAGDWVERWLLPLMLEYPSRELIWRTVRLAGLTSARESLWKTMAKSQDAHPELAAALAALGAWRQMNYHTPKSEVKRFWQDYRWS
jgi:hypothetical protein